MGASLFFLALGGYLMGVGIERMRVRSALSQEPKFLDDLFAAFGFFGVLSNGLVLANHLGLIHY